MGYNINIDTYNKVQAYIQHKVTPVSFKVTPVASTGRCKVIVNKKGKHINLYA